MKNAKEEFIKHVGERTVICAAISIDKKCSLKLNHTEADYSHFLEQLDFLYNNGFGGQELFGTIWYEDGTWSDRVEYDGAEWWEHRQGPEIPEDLKTLTYLEIAQKHGLIFGNCPEFPDSSKRRQSTG